MGKIYNALAKYRQERMLSTTIPKMRKSDWEALLTYDRGNNKLDLGSPDVVKDPQTVPRLLANKMILPDGSLTVAARKRSAEYSRQYRQGPLAPEIGLLVFENYFLTFHSP